MTQDLGAQGTEEITGARQGPMALHGLMEVGLVIQVRGQAGHNLSGPAVSGNKSGLRHRHGRSMIRYGRHGSSWIGVIQHHDHTRMSHACLFAQLQKLKCAPMKGAPWVKARQLLLACRRVGAGGT